MAKAKQININSDKACLAKMLKALGNPVRFKIVELLAEKHMCMTYEIVLATPLAQSTVSQHLKVLREAGLIEGEIDGPATCYCLNPLAIGWLKDQIGAWLPDCCAGKPVFVSVQKKECC